MWNKVNQRIREAGQGIRQAFRAVLTATNSATKVQLLQLVGLKNEGLDGAEYFQHYGFTSNPLPGSMGIVIPLNGSTSHSVIIATEHGTYRLKALKPGEVALYTDEGASVVMKRGRIIETTCDEYIVNCKTYTVVAEQSADFTTPQLTASAQVIAQGKITGNGGMAIKGGGEGGYTATFEGGVNHTGGTFDSVDVTINGVKIGPHIHNTPDGPSGPPING
ncbi:phage baseplate assembly protein V [Trabulsiella odontotermitis]|uniref:phage baseplate assembly protein V n=1 Tax=Trabulsiella odontotermitis TaxID=379893 RepID=UPI000675FAD6|nr:phage baseplate assembly protein V [Trabulsiella odontotermitis]KNC92533.1 phage baseplate protein [Trabulsiella odontotermitis]